MINNKIIYRQAEKNDIPSIKAVDEEHYKEDALSIYEINTCINMFRNSFFVAEDTESQKVIGFCIGMSSKSTKLAWIRAFTVLDSYRKQGIGRSLFEQTIEAFNELKCQNIGLTCEKELVNYYKSFGFVIIKSDLINDGNKKQKYIMNKKLTGGKKK